MAGFWRKCRIGFRWFRLTIWTLVLAGLWVERWWLVAPAFDPSPRLGVPEFSVAVAFAGALGLGMSVFRRSTAVAAPGSKP